MLKFLIIDNFLVQVVYLIYCTLIESSSKKNVRVGHYRTIGSYNLFLFKIKLYTTFNLT